MFRTIGEISFFFLILISLKNALLRRCSKAVSPYHFLRYVVYPCGCLCICAHAHTHTHIYIYIYTQNYYNIYVTYTHICIYIYMCVCVCMWGAGMLCVCTSSLHKLLLFCAKIKISFDPCLFLLT